MDNADEKEGGEEEEEEVEGRGSLVSFGGVGRARSASTAGQGRWRVWR